MYVICNIVYFSLITSKFLLLLVNSLSATNVPQNYFKVDNIKIQYNNSFRIKTRIKFYNDM